MLKNPIFREKSFERLISPERLDELLQVTSAKKWLALLALLLIIIALLLWSFMGSVTMTANGPGIFNPSQEEIISFYPGRLDSILVQPGDIVQAGQTLAIIIPEASLATIAVYQADQYSQRQKGNAANDRNHEEIDNQGPENLQAVGHKVPITSPADGFITEVKKMPGVLVKEKDVVFSLQKWTNNRQPEVIFFLPETDIPGIKQGQDIRIILSNQGTAGSLNGELTYISSFPASPERLAMVFSNLALPVREKMINYFEARGTVDVPPGLTVETLDRKNGTICQVEVITEKKRPIRFLFKK
jgi:biotin carboxyl carrier protein